MDTELKKINIKRVNFRFHDLVFEENDWRGEHHHTSVTRTRDFARKGNFQFFVRALKKASRAMRKKQYSPRILM